MLLDRCYQHCILYLQSNFPALDLKFDPPLSFALDASHPSLILSILIASAFILKHDNLDKFESHSSDDILLSYTPHGRSYRVFNLETNIVVES
jgi:hypothetical protein